MIRKVLIKLLVASGAFIGLILGIFSDVDRGLVGIMGGILVVVVLPVTVLLMIDAARIIKTENPAHRSIRLLGAILGIPQAIMGTVLVAFGLIYPFFGIRDFVADIGAGRSGIIPFVATVTAIALLVVGYYYLREGLGLGLRNRKSK
jgi:hypothetical protein